MKATLDARTLRGALNRVKLPIHGKNYSHPVLSSVMVSSDGDSLRIRATDLETWAETRVAANVHEIGDAVIPFAALSAAAKGKGDAVIVTDHELNATVTVGAISTSMRLSYPVEEFPRWIEQPGDTFDASRGTVELYADDLAYVLHACSNEMQRVVLTGVNFSNSFVCATDSYRLHTLRAELDGLGNTGVIVSAPAMRAAVKHLRGTITVELGQDYARVSDAWKQTTYHGRRIDADFPNWRQLIPENTPKSITFADVDALRAVLTAGSKRDQGNVKLSERNGRVHVCVTGTNAEAELAGSIEAETSVAFNPGFLLDAVTIVDHGPVTVDGVDHLKPWKATDGRRFALLMPVRIS